MEAPLTPPGRVFAAVVPPPEVRAALVQRLDPLEIPGRPVPPGNWHLTLRFIGEVEATGYERWLAELDESAWVPPFRVRLGGLDAFPRRAKATVLWVGAHSDSLAGLAATVDEAAANAGLGNEERPFRPHLTISRVRPPADVRGLVEQAGEEWDIAFRVNSFHIMAAAGNRYRTYETFAL